MKNFTLIILVSILLSTIGNSQVTFVPDNNFEQALIDLGYDTLLNNFVPTANINTVTSLNLQNKNIGNLRGIEDFSALQVLYVDDNNLSTLDVTQNTALTLLSCSNNNLTSLDVTQNTSLDYLEARFNVLTDLNVTQNTELQTLSVGNNQLTLLNLNQNGLLSLVDCGNNNLGGLSLLNGNNTGIVFFNTTNNPGLICIQVDDVAYASANWTNIDSQTSFNASCQSQVNTYVPDDNFEQALIDLGYDSGPLDDYVLRANINTVTELEIGNRNIDNLIGIKDFAALETLICLLNNLTSLDISQNTALETLNCSVNQLTNLDVSQNTALTLLYCNENQLSSLDISQNINLVDFECFANALTSLVVSQNTALERLDCRGNQISNIDVSSNPALMYLNVLSNQLENLDVSNNIAITYLSCESNAITDLNLVQNVNLELLECSSNALTSLNIKNGNNTAITSFYATDNPNLTCIEVDDATYSSANWTNIDAQTSFSEDCSAQTYVPDDNFEQALIDLGYDSGTLDDYVLTSNIDAITLLNIGNKNIDVLTGIEDFTALKILETSSNNLVSLNVNQNVNLEAIYCSYNLLTAMDFSPNTALVTINISSNTLSSLDLSQNMNLTELNCSDNQLTSLNVKNGNNTAITAFSATNNPNLTCIEVDDAAYSNNNWLNIDIQTSFSEDCSAQTYVPDDNFEQALIDLGYDTVLDNYVPTANINAETYLNLANQNVSDLTGIEDFVALEIFVCSNNQITDADMSQNTALTYLNFVGNQITNLNVNQNTVLEYLSVSDNQLTTLDISQNTSLINFNIDNNQLTNIDISQNTLLEIFTIRNNQLSNIDLNQNIALETLDISSNQITALDLSVLINLITLACDDNDLTTLNLKNGNNTNISFIDATNNPNLNCIEVDNAVYSISNWSNIDTQSGFSIDCSNSSNCANAEMIQVSETVTTVDFDFTNEIFSNGMGCTGNMVAYAMTWFEFSMPEDGAISIDGAINANKLMLYDSCGNTALACFSNSELVSDLTNGTTYKLLVFRTAENAGNTDFRSFNINIETTLNLEESVISNASVSLYPNPTSGTATIKTPLNTTVDAVTVMDISGKTIVKQNNTNTIDVSELSHGMYFLNIEIDHQLITKKLMVKKN